MPRPPFNNGTWSCALCGTFTTPVRRAGESGSKALCNACGLRRSKTTRLARFPSGIAAPPGAAATKPRRGRPRTRSRSGAFVALEALDADTRDKRPPPILVPHPPFAAFTEATYGNPLSAHTDTPAARDAHYGRGPPYAGPPLQMSDVLSPLSSASSLGHAPPDTHLFPPPYAYAAPSFGDIVDAMSSVSRSAASPAVVSRPAVSRPTVSDTSANGDDRFPAAEGGDADALRQNLQALNNLMHDGGGSGDSAHGGLRHRQWVV